MVARRKAVILVVSLAACGDSPFEPRGRGERVPIDQVIDDQITDSVARRYSFEAAADGEYAVFLKSFEGFVVLSVEDSVGRRCAVGVQASPGTVPLEENPTPPCVTPNGGVELISVHVFGSRTARYQFKVFPVNRRPESADSQLALGDTVTGEGIDPVVDADVFYAHGDSGQTVTAIIESLGGASSGGLILFVEDPDTIMWLGYARGAGADPLFTSGPLRLPGTKDYRFVVRGEATYNRPRHRGAYRFWTHVVRRQPEHLPPALVANAPYLGERIDYPNDVDEFTFQDTVGAEFNAFLESGRHFVIQVVPPGSNEAMKGRVDADDDTALFHHGTGPFQLTDTGTYKIRVQAPTGLPWAVADTGPYRFMLYRIDRRPEHGSATVQVGDTVSNELIEPGGDIDEFTLVGTPDDHLVVWFRLVANPIPEGVYMALEVIGPNGELLGRTFTEQARDFIQGIAITIPATGSLRIRVGQFAGVEAATAPYEFYIANAP